MNKILKTLKPGIVGLSVPFNVATALAHFWKGADNPNLCFAIWGITEIIIILYIWEKTIKK
jgi:hypothetical protein